MIARCWRGRTTDDNAARYHEHFTSKVVPVLRAIPGFAGARVLRRPHTLGVEFFVMTEWESWDSIRAFAGPEPERAVVEEGARAVLANYDSRVEHFEDVE